MCASKSCGTIKAWIDNEEPTYKYFRDRAKELIAETDDKEGRIVAMIYDLKYFVEDNCPELGATLYADILTAGLERINFWEVAEILIEDNID